MLKTGIQFFAPEGNEGLPYCAFYLDGKLVHEASFQYYITSKSTAYYSKFVSQDDSKVTVEFSVTGGESVAGGTETEQYTYDYGVDIESVTYDGYTSGSNNLTLNVYAISKSSGGGGGDVSKVSIDLTALSGYEALADGTYNITVKAKADGYADSDLSAGVSWTKETTTKSAVGTWLLNESLSGLSTKTIWYVTGSFTGCWSSSFELYSIAVDSSVVSIDSPFDVGYCGGNEYYYTVSGDLTFSDPSALSLSGSYIRAWLFEVMESSGYGFEKTSAEGIKLRTFTITGGTDATNSNLIAWLEANATRVEGGGN